MRYEYIKYYKIRIYYCVVACVVLFAVDALSKNRFYGDFYNNSFWNHNFCAVI